MSDDLVDGYYWWSTGERWVMLCLSDGQWWSNDMPVDPPLPDDQLVAVPNAARIRELKEMVRAAREAMLDVVSAWDWWNVDQYDRCQSVPGDAVDALRALLARMGERDDRA